MKAAKLCVAAHTQLLHFPYFIALNCVCVLLKSMNDSTLKAGYIMLYEILNDRQLTVQQ
jgi:hypothetical protein